MAAATEYIVSVKSTPVADSETGGKPSKMAKKAIVRKRLCIQASGFCILIVLRHTRASHHPSVLNTFECKRPCKILIEVS